MEMLSDHIFAFLSALIASWTSIADLLYSVYYDLLAYFYSYVFMVFLYSSR